MNKIEEVLNQKFEDQRIIFWYDEKQEMLNQFNALDLKDVEKIHIQKNEFEVKYIIIKQKPTSKFLLYFDNKKPVNEENWLLDLEIANYVFQTDQESLILQEMGLDYHLKDFISNHIEFFKSKERKSKFEELIEVEDSKKVLKYKMLSIIFNNENVNLATFIISHAKFYYENNTSIEKDLERFNLAEFYWKEISLKYNYISPEPSIYDFMLEIFANQFVILNKPGLSNEARLLFSNWKDSIQFRRFFGEISDKISDELSIQDKLVTTNIETIIADDTFKLVEKKIIHELVELVVNDEISKEKVLNYIKERKNKYWYGSYESLYDCISHGAELISLIENFADLNYNSFEEGTSHYAKYAYIVDYQYRKFIWNFRLSKQDKVLDSLNNKIEKKYSNDWLLNYNDKWQTVIDNLDKWPSIILKDQRRFFEQHIKVSISKKQKIFVIISDAFRYECGAELLNRIQSENRFEANLDYLVSTLPSYTQLGMAALLPHKNLKFSSNTDSVLVDGLSTIGTIARSKILEREPEVRATSIKAEEFMAMNSSKEGRDFVKKHDVMYIYHNRIDKVGDDKTSESKVFEAVEEEIGFLILLLKKISSMNGSNMIITSDHGFIYQNSELNESDFTNSSHSGDIWKENRRFVIGHNLVYDNSTKKFKAVDLGIDSDADILIPKSINRLRVKGAGSRFIHGGASLQEIINPLLFISKKRKDTTSKVDVDIIKTTDRITVNLLVISFIQTKNISENILPRGIRAAIYATDGEILSDIFKYTFDIKDNLDRNSEVKHKFQLSSKASSKYKNQNVKLLLEEPVEGTSKWKIYKEFIFTINISFTNDFDN